MEDVVIWSGGADSTYVLNELGKDSSENNPVIAVSIESDLCCDIKKRKESEARQALLKEFKSRGYHIKHYTYECNGTLLSDGGNLQPIIWLSAVMPYLPRPCKVHMGYIIQDSIWHKREELFKAFKWMDRLRFGEESELCLSIEWSEKKDIINRLISEGLYKYIWTCEVPKKNGSRCGKCSPCKTEKSCLSEIRES